MKSLAHCIFCLWPFLLVCGCGDPQPDLPPATDADAANLQRLVGNWYAVQDTSGRSHSRFTIRGDEIVVTTIWDKDWPEVNILRGETRVEGMLRLRGRRLSGPWAIWAAHRFTVLAIVSEDFREIYFTVTDESGAKHSTSLRKG